MYTIKSVLEVHASKKYKTSIAETVTVTDKCDPLYDLVPFVQFKKREKHPWRSVNFSKVAGLSDVLLSSLLGLLLFNMFFTNIFLFCLSDFGNCSDDKTFRAMREFINKISEQRMSQINFLDGFLTIALSLTSLDAIYL